MGFVAPYWFALLIPALFLIWRFPHHRPASNSLRSLAAVLMITALAQPYLSTFDPGRHVVVLVDRSLSMPVEHSDRALETIRLLEAARAQGDALGILSFGAHPRLDRQPSDSLRFGGFQTEVNGQASDLAGALAMGLDWIPAGRQGSLLILSDGEATGTDPVVEAHRAAARGIRIDAVPAQQTRREDTAVERFDLPAEVHAGEPFQFEAWVHAAARETREVELRRDGVVISRREQALEPGPNRLLFRDRVEAGGVATYALAVRPLTGAPSDARPENDRGLGAVRAIAPTRVLLLNEDGQTDTLASALSKAGLPVDVRTPEDAQLTRLGLTAYRAVILENVMASRLGFDGMHALRDFVVERGGGLWMTGGRASFGTGGYHLSPIDAVLPVASDMRSDMRKVGLGLGLVLDRSGSMAVEVSPGVSKMDLANNGSIAAIEMLGPIDYVTVFAVDTQPHLVVPFQSASKFPSFRADVLGIRSQGGGIFTFNGLEAVADVVRNANLSNRHIILFADAADAEQHTGVEALIGELAAENITVSVIALGTELDPDAEFLADVAAWGGGEVYFTTEARELPRLFAQDTMNMARAMFIMERHAVRMLPGGFAMGEFGFAADGGLLAFPALDGYNQVHPRPNTNIAAMVADEQGTPLFASAQRGAGRAVSYAGQIGGTYGQDLVAWSEFANFATSVTRYLIGESEPTAFFATTEVVGQTAIVRVEVDPREAPDTSLLEAHITTGDGQVHVLPMRSTGERHFEARLELDQPGVALGNVHLAGGRSLELPPMALPYSPEFARRDDPRSGAALLTTLTQITGGSLLANLGSAFQGPRAGVRWRTLAFELFIAALLVLLAEIAVRRLALFVRQAPAEAPAPSTPQVRTPERAKPAPLPETRHAGADTKTAPPELSNLGAGSMEEALQRARKRADRRLDR